MRTGVLGSAILWGKGETENSLSDSHPQGGSWQDQSGNMAFGSSRLSPGHRTMGPQRLHRHCPMSERRRVKPACKASGRARGRPGSCREINSNSRSRDNFFQKKSQAVLEKRRNCLLPKNLRPGGNKQMSSWLLSPSHGTHSYLNPL